MIRSILDTDLYKFTTSYAYMKLYPDAEGTFTFVDRDNTTYTQEFVEILKSYLKDLSTLELQPLELLNLKATIRFIPDVYWEWLRGFRFESERIDVFLDEESHLHIEVTDKLYKVTLYEVPILAIVSELRNQCFNNNLDNFDDVLERLNYKICIANDSEFKFSEFGTRRRFSFNVQEFIVDNLCKKCPKTFVGTSNVYLALKYKTRVVGTFPHEWVMFHGAIWGYQEANYLAMRDWVRTYDGDLGIFLIDTYTSKVGLNNMSKKYAKLFDGVRQDSGDEYKIGNMIIERYHQLGIDPTTKTIVFSNALTFDKFAKIARYFSGRIRVSAGIGTNLTNDCGFKPANIVMKLSKVKINSNQPWRNCIKISDDIGKFIGDVKEFEIAKHQLGIC